MQPSWTHYLESLGNELLSQADRVRSLIGDRHWLSDGHHKEYLFGELVRRHAPTGMLAARGFVIDPHDSSRVSREQDLLIVDSMREGAVFNQGGLLVSFPGNVVAAVSIKTEMDSATTRDAVAGLASVADVARSSAERGAIWYGAYFFSCANAVTNEPAKVFDYVRAGLRDAPVRPVEVSAREVEWSVPTCLSDARKHTFFVRANRGDGIAGLQLKVSGFRSAGLGTALFLADLLRHLAAARGGEDPRFIDYVEQAPLEPMVPPSSVVEMVERRDSD